MNAPAFTTMTYITRGSMEREIEVEVHYTFDGEHLEVVGARDLTEGRELSYWEWSHCEDAAGEVCEKAYAEWLADYGEYLRDAADDRRVAA